MDDGDDGFDGYDGDGYDGYDGGDGYGDAVDDGDEFKGLDAGDDFEGPVDVGELTDASDDPELMDATDVSGDSELMDATTSGSDASDLLGGLDLEIEGTGSPDSSDVGEDPELLEIGESSGDVELLDSPNEGLSDDWDDIDFSATMNTPYEQDVIAQMDEAGELDVPEVDPGLEEPEFGTQHLPTEASGTFEGERGNSSFVPSSKEARAAMAEYGADSVEYVDGEPDFSPFTEHETPYGTMDCSVEIGHMTTDRANPSWEYGDRRPAGASHDPAYDLGNFAQADNALVDRAIEQDPGLVEGKSPEEVAQLRADMARDLESWRTSNGYTWHECRGGATMQLVPTPIHDACRHSGGVSTMRTVQAYGDVRRDD